jgi:8-oxo-dGTP pyrophosphatase MutT (NUDIX family)
MRVGRPPLSQPDFVTAPPSGRRRGGDQIIPQPDEWWPGPQPPWPLEARPTMADLLRSVSIAEEPIQPAFEKARGSAVLVVLAPGQDGPEVLLTRRSREMRNHPGEVSFPGGRIDPGEGPIDAALREAHEEVGLEPDLVSMHGELTHLNTPVSLSYIIPKVATVDRPVELLPQTMEADRVLWVPLSEFTRPNTYRSEYWGFERNERLLHFFELDDETVWGATARMMVDLITRAIKTQ